MNGLICLLVFCLLAVTALAALGLCRRLFSHELPEHMATLALLESQAQWERQCAALAAQLTWTDRDMVRTVWLVDATPDGSLEQGCTAILQTAQRLLLLPAVGVDENFWQRCGIRKK